MQISHHLARARARRGRPLAATALVAGLLAVPTAPAVAASGPGTPTAKASQDTRLDARTRARLDRTLKRALARTWAPGAIAGVWAGDRGWTAATGIGDRDTGDRPALDDHTRVGSVTKTFTGTLILQLVDEGRLSLDDPIERWFPGVRGTDEITVRDLGAMSSGIASYSRNERVVDRYLARPQTSWTPSELIAASLRLPRVFRPGDGFDYSNTNVLMLGQIVEQVTRRPLVQVMQEKLFGPLGMRETTYRPSLRLPAPSWHGYTLQGATAGVPLDATAWNPTFSGAAGQIVSTLGDLRRWTRAVGSGSLLTPATQRARLVPNPASERGGRAYLFGIGKAGDWLMHSGVLPGFNTQIAYLPERDLSIVVLTNADIPTTAGTPAPAIFDALADVVAPGTLPGG